MEKKKTKKNTAKAAPKKELALSALVYNQNGKETGEVKLPEKIFGLSWNGDLVHQVVYSMLSNKRTIYAHTKGRGDVRGGGRKPWQQKGTGRARHGSTRSPIWVGGGIAHGPNNLKNYERKINRKMKSKALFTILSKKLKDKEIIFVDKFEISQPKTKEALKILKNMKVNNIGTLISISNKKPSFEKSFANIGNVKVDEFRNINPVDILNKRYLIIENPEESIKILESKLQK